MALTIEMKRDGGDLTVALGGRLNGASAPELEEKLRPALTPDVENVTIDLEKLAYISSAGLRVLLSAQKIMNRQGEMVVRNANDAVMDVFDVTGFIDLLNIE